MHTRMNFQFLVAPFTGFAFLLGACGGGGGDDGVAPPAPDTAPRFGTATIEDVAYVIDKAIMNLTLPAAEGGDGVLSYALTPDLPSGLTFTASDRVISGTPSEVSAKTEYTYRVTDGDSNTSNSDSDTLTFHITVTSPALRATLLDEYQYRQKTDSSAAGTGESQWSAVAWRGDREHASLLITADDDKQRSMLEIEVSDFVDESDNVIASDQVRILYPRYVAADSEIRGCNGYAVRSDEEAVHLADALSSEPGEINLPAEPFPLWLIIDVPRTACPGEYRGSVSINDPSDELSETSLTLNLEVLPLDLQEPGSWQFELDVWQHPEWVLHQHNNTNPDTPIERWSQAHYGLLEASYRLLGASGQKSITATLKDGALGTPGMVVWTRVKEDAQEWRFDFSRFGEYVDKLMSWGIEERIDAHGIVGWNRNEIPYWSEQFQEQRTLEAPIGSAAHNTAWRAFLSEFRSYLKDQGWFDLTYLAVDERPNELAQLIDLIHADNAAWKISLWHAGRPLPENLADELDATSVFLGSVEDNTSAESENALRTFYTSCSYDPTKPITRMNSFLTTDSSAADVEWLTWYVEKTKHDGFSRWAYDYWRSSDPLDLRRGLNHTSGDFALIYRTSNAPNLMPMTSVRFEMLRHGVQAFEKRRILRELFDEQQHASGLSQLDALMGDDYISVQGVVNKSVADDVRRAQQQLDRISMDASALVSVDAACN